MYTPPRLEIFIILKFYNKLQLKIMKVLNLQVKINFFEDLVFYKEL
jgi:hypothetical protein